MQDKWRRTLVGLGTAVATFALVVPVGAAGKCAGGFCLVSVPGADTHPAAAYGKLDTYWRDPPQDATTVAVSDAFDWSAFGIGAGLAFGSTVLLAGLGAGVAFRVARGRTASPVETA